MDLSDPKTWTDGLDVVVRAPHIVFPLLIAVGWGCFWVRGRFDKSKIDGLEQRLDLAKEQQSYLTKKLADAEAEIVKLEQQTREAVPELLHGKVISTLRYVREATAANTDLGNTISDYWVALPHREK